MNFGQPSPNPVEMADWFWSTWAIMPLPPAWNRVKGITVMVNLVIVLELLHTSSFIEGDFHFPRQCAGKGVGYPKGSQNGNDSHTQSY